MSAHGTNEQRNACRHDVFDLKNTLVVESNMFSGSRIRCKKCGACAWIGKRGRIEPQTCECHGGNKTALTVSKEQL